MVKLVKLFTQESCPKCPAAKEVISEIKKDGISVKEYDVKGDPDAMSEAAFHEVMSTPTIIVVDENDVEVKSWRTKVPAKEEITKAIEE